MEEDTFIPDLAWFTLQEACEMKGLNYHTALNRKELRPNGGVPDGTIGGEKGMAPRDDQGVDEEVGLGTPQ